MQFRGGSGTGYDMRRLGGWAIIPITRDDGSVGRWQAHASGSRDAGHFDVHV
jgi:hypothetical protein